MRIAMRIFSEELWQAWRGIRARPSVSILAISVLAAGLASALRIASFINALVLNPLPFEQSDQLFRVGLIDNDDDLDSKRYDSARAEDVLDWQERLAEQADVAAYSQLTLNLGTQEHSERYSGGRISANLLTVLGVKPSLGRGFSAEDEKPGASNVVLLSDSVWRTRFGADPSVLGRTIRINTQPTTVIGVLPPEFSFPWREKLWQPLQLKRGAGPDECCFDVVLRPKSGVLPAQIGASLADWFAWASTRDPESMRSRARAVGFDPLRYQFVDRETIGVFGVMAVAVALVLMIACANVANLLLGRLLAREGEMALRAAIGASRSRLLLNSLLQAGLLSLIAVILAMPMAQLGVNAAVAEMRSSVETGPPEWLSFAIDMRMIGIAIVIAALTAFASGLLPALHAAGRRDLSLRSNQQGAGGFAKVSQWLMVGQVAFSLAVLIATVMLVQTVRKLDQFDLGLDTHNVLTARIGLMPERFSEPAELRRHVAQLLEVVRAAAEVESATISTSLPGLMGGNEDAIEFGTDKPPQGYASAGYSAVDPSFFSSMGATLVAGRLLNEADTVDSAPVMVVDQTFATQYLGTRNPVGRRFVLDPEGSNERSVTIVGVIRPVQMDDIDAPREASMFVPFAQSPQTFFTLLIRTRNEPMAFAPSLIAIAHGLDADSPLYWIRAYDNVLYEATIGQHLLANLFGSFGVIALLLASAGLYGLVAFNVARSTREIGVRRALGAASGALMFGLLRRTLTRVGLGLILGLAIGLPFANLLQTMLGNTGLSEMGMNLMICLPALLLLSAAATLACWLPARRALHIAPTVALRQE